MKKKFVLENEMYVVYEVASPKNPNAFDCPELSCVYTCDQYKKYETNKAFHNLKFVFKKGISLRQRLWYWHCYTHNISIIPADAICSKMAAGPCKGDCLLSRNYARLSVGSASLPKRIQIQR